MKRHGLNANQHWYCHQTNPTFSQNIVNYDGIWHFYMNKFKKLIIDFENKYLQMSLLYNYFHEAKLKCTYGWNWGTVQFWEYHTEGYFQVLNTKWCKDDEY
jgi:hypothetical protein